MPATLGSFRSLQIISPGKRRWFFDCGHGRQALKRRIIANGIDEVLCRLCGSFRGRDGPASPWCVKALVFQGATRAHRKGGAKQLRGMTMVSSRQGHLSAAGAAPGNDQVVVRRPPCLTSGTRRRPPRADASAPPTSWPARPSPSCAPRVCLDVGPRRATRATVYSASVARWPLRTGRSAAAGRRIWECV